MRRLSVLVLCCACGGLAPSAGCGRDQARYTILLCILKGPGHVEHAAQAKAEAAKFAPAAELRILHKAEHTELYWSSYSSVDAAHGDLAKAKAHRLGKSGYQVFRGALVVPLPGEHVGRSEWDLRNVSRRFEYTVLVAEFFNERGVTWPQGRKQAAVDYCQELRGKGYQAFYHHGPARSKVTVGAFGPKAMQQVQSWKKNAAGEYELDPKTHQRVPVYSWKLVDPRARKIMKTSDPPLCFLARNGMMETRAWVDRQGKKHKVPIGSKLIVIPRSSEDRKRATAAPPARTGHTKRWEIP